MACRYNLQNKYNELANNCDLYTRLQPNYQENLINEIAFSIDEAENKTLEAILHHYRPQREGVEAVAKSAKDPENKGTSPFSVNLET
ncbi:hypothetical protein IJM86_08705 [bacterium]|nr:hypothetical protein [bacterium]